MQTGDLRELVGNQGNFAEFLQVPTSDGYETIRHIRAQQRFKTLPILTLTAKAMKGDREKCLEAGANDYLPKPVDIDRLFSMLRVWLFR